MRAMAVLCLVNLFSSGMAQFDTATRKIDQKKVNICQTDYFHQLTFLHNSGDQIIRNSSLFFSGFSTKTTCPRFWDLRTRGCVNVVSYQVILRTPHYLLTSSPPASPPDHYLTTSLTISSALTPPPHPLLTTCSTS